MSYLGLNPCSNLFPCSVIGSTSGSGPLTLSSNLGRGAEVNCRLNRFWWSAEARICEDNGNWHTNEYRRGNADSKIPSQV